MSTVNVKLGPNTITGVETVELESSETSGKYYKFNYLPRYSVNLTGSGVTLNGQTTITTELYGDESITVNVVALENFNVPDSVAGNVTYTKVDDTHATLVVSNLTANLSLSVVGIITGELDYFYIESVDADEIWLDIQGTAGQSTYKKQYRINYGEWTQFWDRTTLNINYGDKIFIRNDPTTTGSYIRNLDFFILSGGSYTNVHYKIGGNIMSIVDHTCQSLVIPRNNFFESMFTQGHLTDITNLKLPATTLTEGCYLKMFQNCDMLTSIPTNLLPATTLQASCYSGMFWGCTSITTAPNLPATTLAQSCYVRMFNGCTSLTNVPDLIASDLPQSCYFYMFNGCTSLVNCPKIQATTISGNECCYGMFSSCSTLATLPRLKALVLSDRCYAGYMFPSSVKLSTTQTGDYQNEYRIPWSGTGTSGTNSTSSMFAGGVNTPDINTTYYTNATIVGD